MQAEQQAALQDIGSQRFARAQCMEGLGDVDPQVRLLQDVQEVGHWPVLYEGGGELHEVGR